MSLLSRLNEIEVAKNNIKTSLENKGKQPGNDIRNYAAVINSLNGDVASPMKVKVIIQELEPENSSYQGFWIKSSTYTYNEIHIITDRTELYANSINIIKKSKQNKYKTILLDSDVSGGLYFDFNEVIITNADNEAQWNIPIYYGNGTEWLDITPTNIHWAGVHVDYATKTVTRLEGSSDINEIKCYADRIRCNMTDDGTVTARFGDSNYDNVGNENLQVMVEQPITYVKVSNVQLGSDGHTILSADYCIADGPFDSEYQIHKAFIVGNDIYNNIYLNAFEGVVKNDKLCSNGDNNAPTGNRSRVSFRTCASKRGSIWRQWTYLADNLETLLLLIEYCTFDWYKDVARGRTSSSAARVGEVSVAQLNENGTGFQNGDKTANLSFAYRYRENPYGSMGKMLDGYERSGDNIFISNSNFDDNFTQSSTKTQYSAHCYYSGGGNTYFITYFSYIEAIPYLFEPCNGGGESYVFGTKYSGTSRYYAKLSQISNKTSMLFYYAFQSASGNYYGDIGGCLMCYPTNQIQNK